MSPIIVLTLLLFSVSLTFAQKQCPKCGSMEVPYPLSTSPNCGLPNYKLSCNNNNDQLDFLSVYNFAYRVLSITPEASRLIIQPPTNEKDTCLSSDLAFNGLRIDATSPFNISKINTVMLFNCSDKLKLSPLDCSPTSPCNRLIGEESDCGNKLCCSYLKDASMTSRQIRVRPGSCTAYTSVVDFKPDQSVSEWNFGIELQWLPPN